MCTTWARAGKAALMIAIVATWQFTLESIGLLENDDGRSVS